MATLKTPDLIPYLSIRDFYSHRYVSDISLSLAAILDFGRHLGNSETAKRAPRLKIN